MGTSLLQVRVEDTLKKRATAIFEELGFDASSAIRMFLKRVVLENGIPFRTTLPREPYVAERGYRAMVELSENAEKNGASNMTLEEINAEIDAVREKRTAAKGCKS